ncbi:MAG TPA: GNAT family N-acetyltransferase [Methylomusa anaerophila]|uniref:Ribosomal-protein-alanine N-acetyltransferase n=1 Tax=Methylomusa anaerophila TaxID=1930071 RepID=A0A348AJA9_9FIRM|nr:GNAT family N-acetyltransferase [Methylomusa anaerophila]BBB91157.1 ribosomal-protein-alanine N-acetyltransferase [Methylomusa anaerophila]HML89035.1 GNAT family N-acetyltransferase [Methylomusa anaerophila]
MVEMIVMVELVDKNDIELIPQLVKLEAEAFGQGGLNEWHLVPIIRHGRVYISKKGEKVVGSVQYILDWDNPQKAYMIGVSVSPEYRGRGIGTELLKETFKALSRENIAEVELTVAPDNLAAIKVYERKLKFVVTEYRKNEYGNHQDRLVMNLSLA